MKVRFLIVLMVGSALLQAEVQQAEYKANTRQRVAALKSTAAVLAGAGVAGLGIGHAAFGLMVLPDRELFGKLVGIQCLCVGAVATYTGAHMFLAHGRKLRDMFVEWREKKTILKKAKVLAATVNG